MQLTQVNLVLVLGLTLTLTSGVHVKAAAAPTARKLMMHPSTRFESGESNNKWRPFNLREEEQWKMAQVRN